LQSCVPKIIKNLCIFVKVIVEKSVAPFICGHGVYYDDINKPLCA